MRTPDQKAKSDEGLQEVIRATEKLWRRHRLTYDQTRYVAKCARQTLKIERPAKRARTIERLSRDEERRLIESAYRQPGTRGLMVKALLQTGARVSEFINIRVEDVYFEEQEILIRQGKGGKSRSVPILPSLAQELRTHLKGRAVGYLFETNRHAGFSARRVQQLVREIAAQAGITKKVSPHILRHSVATTLLEQGMPLEQIQKFLGHAKIDTTQIYAETSAALIKHSYQKALSG